MLVVLTLFFGLALAQRPSNASLCDYYAQSLYGTNNSDTQFRLVQSIISLAFGGGSTLKNVSSEITGILHPGSFEGENVDLQPWFNGTLASTNLNNQPVGINWLDDGGVTPLYKFLSGETPNVVLSNSSNEYRLFGHFYVVFSRMFGCSNPPAPPPSTGGPLSLAYVHKYMNLNYTDLGHFINQLCKSTIYFGFSEQDSRTLSTSMNSLYNVRCAPAVTFSSAQGPQLLSLCQASSCPLAAPNPDCAPYVNLTANGIQSSAPSSAGSTATASSSGSLSTAAAPITTITASPSATATSATSPTALSSGSIAGIAIGGAAVLIMLISAIIFFLRRRNSAPTQVEPAAPIQYASTPASPMPAYQESSVKDNHASYVSYEPTLAEMESPRHPRSPEMSVYGRLELAGGV